MIENIIIKALNAEVKISTRETQRDMIKVLQESKYCVVYPQGIDCDDGSIHYNKVAIVFSNDKPEYIQRGFIDAIDKFSYNDNVYWCSWGTIAPHILGTVWIETSKFDPVVIEPCPFETLDKYPVLGLAPNTHFHDAVTDFMGISDNYEVDSVLEKYLETLAPEELRFEIIYSDLDDRGYTVSGRQSTIIRYQNEVIGYAELSGRELLYCKYSTQTIDKFHAAVKDIIDKCGIYDSMYHNGVKLISTEDADTFFGIPGLTPKKFE